MAYENFSYQIETMKKKNEMNELTKALNSGMDVDMLYKAFRDLYMATINSRIVRGGDGLNVDGLFSDVNTGDVIYSLLDLVKAYLKHSLSKKEAIEAAINLSKQYYLIASSAEERSRHLTYIEDIGVGVEESGTGAVERARNLFWNTLKADLTVKVNELLD